MTIETPDSILRFWFGDGTNNRQIGENRQKLWWSKHDNTDAQIKHRFSEVVEAVYYGRQSDWLGSANGLLASIICLDQFPRNIYRNTARSFAYDEKARELATILRDEKWDTELLQVQRVFAYLPYEHSESIQDQTLSVSLYQSLRDEVKSEDREMFDNFYQFAVKHYEFIERFGRFPHRNVILGRQSSDAEIEFLKQPGSSF